MARTRTITSFYGESALVLAEGCNAITFYRPVTNPLNAAASNPVKVDGVPIEAGQAYSIKQNVGDQDFSQYDVVFLGGAGEDMLYVIRIMAE
jgi:hypothetical protein